MLIEIKSPVDNKVIGVMVVNPKTFSTGSTGFFGSTKLEIEGERYQVQFQAVKIGSKPQK